MKRFRRFGAHVLATFSVGAILASAQAAPYAKADPDWPCHQAKIGDFPLASVWDGPPLDVDATAWRDDPAIVELVSQMSQRRVPIAEVQTAVGKLIAPADPAGKEKLKQAFAAAFDELVRQRAEIIAGLDRYGRKQRAMADRIRAENAAAHSNSAPADNSALQRLQWDLRVYDERRRTVAYVCEAPQAIEARIGEIVKVVRAAL